MITSDNVFQIKRYAAIVTLIIVSHIAISVTIFLLIKNRWLLQCNNLDTLSISAGFSSSILIPIFAITFLIFYYISNKSDEQRTLVVNNNDVITLKNTDEESIVFSWVSEQSHTIDNEVNVKMNLSIEYIRLFITVALYLGMPIFLVTCVHGLLSTCGGAIKILLYLGTFMTLELVVTSFCTSVTFVVSYIYYLILLNN